MAKLLFAVTTDLNFDQRMIRICGTLAGHGYSVELCGRRLPHSPDLAPQAYAQHRFRCQFTKGKLFYMEYNLRLFFFILFRRPDVVCAADLDTLAGAYAASRLTGARLVYDAHEYFTEVPELEGRPLTKKIWELLAAWILPRIRYAYTVSYSLAGILSNRYGITFQTIRNMPLPLKLRFPLIKKAIPPIILYQGALNKGRGLETAIEAMRDLPMFRLILAGEGDLSDALRQHALQAGVQDRVFFAGKLEPKMLARLTTEAFLGLNLLESNSQSYYYSLANKAFDYVQAHVPSIQMDFPEYRRLNAEIECFILLPKLDKDSLVHAIKSLLNDQERYQTFQFNCKLAAYLWTWEEEQKRLLEFYARVLEA